MPLLSALLPRDCPMANTTRQSKSPFRWPPVFRAPPSFKTSSSRGKASTHMVKNGIAEVFETAKTQSWILSEGYELKEWPRLLPFATPPPKHSLSCAYSRRST